MSNNQKIDFTDEAWSVIYSVVDDPIFQKADAHLIYEALQSSLSFVPFGQYLKRYIYKKAGLKGDFDEIPLETYKQIIKESFAENRTPPSFTDADQKISTAAANFLTRQTVHRNAVFLLGFGLSMSMEDVSDFLTKALKEPSFNKNDPFELICLYCFYHGYGFLKYKRLYERYEELKPAARKDHGKNRGGAESFAEAVLKNDETLLIRLAALKSKTEESISLRNTRAAFERLLRQISDALNAERQRAGAPERRETTASDIEKLLYSAVPVDANRNLSPANRSKLYAQFGQKRLTRQRIGRIVQGKTPPDRFDLITLSFCLLCKRTDGFASPKKRYAAFTAETNALLTECGFAPLYAANPYECFILMCILSADPLETFAQVWQRSYDKEEIGAANDLSTESENDYES